MGILMPVFGFELLSPVIAIFILAEELLLSNKLKPDLENLLPYRYEAGIIPFYYKVFQMPMYFRVLIYFAIMILLVTIQLIFTWAIGQEPDSIIRVFTNSVGFIFSN
jgi:NADH:ubiquinone oxidoreductase subunit 3 (subunit A)